MHPSRSDQNVIKLESISHPLYLPVICSIGAARSFDDLPIGDWRETRPVESARPLDQFCFAQVSGESLYEDGIHDGDFILIRLTFEDLELTPGRLLAVFTPYGLLIKHVYKTLDNKVRLVSANPAYEDILLEADDVTVQGIAIRVERDL